MRKLLCGETCPLTGCKAPWVHSAFYENVYLHRWWLSTQSPYVQSLTPWSPPLLPFTAGLCLKHHTPLSWHMLFLSPQCPLPLFPFLLLFKSQLEGHLIHSLTHSFIQSTRAKYSPSTQDASDSVLITSTYPALTSNKTHHTRPGLFIDVSVKLIRF